MNRTLHFSWKISIIGFLLVLAFLRLAYWQWDRHTEKVAMITELEQRLSLPITPLQSVFSSAIAEPGNFIHRKVRIAGTYDFAKEIYIKNRRKDDTPGVLVVTPLQLENSDTRVLVNRGFLPLALYRSGAAHLHGTKSADFIGLIKPSVPRRSLAPKDPQTSTKIWHDSFLRIDIAHLAKQYQYPLAPFYVDRMEEVGTADIKDAVVRSSSKKEELLLLPLRALNNEKRTQLQQHSNDFNYPLPFFNTILPAGRHLGYVFEWSAMAVFTILICVILQFKRPPSSQHSVTE